LLTYPEVINHVSRFTNHVVLHLAVQLGSATFDTIYLAVLTMSTDRLEQLKTFYEEDPEDPFTRYALAQEHLKHDHTDRALALFEELVETDPDYVGTYYHLGKLYEQLDRTDDALDTYEQGIEMAREHGTQKDLSELQDAKMNAKGIGFD
jgi:tetratricopeptide (TPR) repeat protein